MKFGLRGHDIGDSFDEMIEKAVSNGVEVLQLALAKTLADVDFYKIGYSKELSLKIKNALEENNISVSVLGCYINPVEQDAEGLEKNLVLFENFICYAKDFNAKVIGTETGCLDTLEATRSEENYQFFLKNLKRLVKKAEENDVVIGIEPVSIFTVYSPEIMARVLSDINSDNLAVIFDLSNIITVENFMEQHKIIDAAFDLPGNRIKVVHLKDFVIEDNKKKFATVGTGLYDIEYLFSKIKGLSEMPDIILDETLVEHYKESIKNIRRNIKRWK